MYEIRSNKGVSIRSRGEGSFINLPSFGARLYDSLTRARAIEIQFREVAEDMVSRINHGRLLDIGTGPGRLLLEIHRLNPDIGLFGLDIADTMVQLARKNLAEIGADLQQGNIRSTDYDSSFFDLITCTGSMYLWDNPEECLEEISRILKNGRSAYLFETYRDFNEDEFEEALLANLRKDGLIRRLITPLFLKKQLKMTYTTNELVEIIERTSFTESYAIEKIILSGLPIWLRITLTKGLSN